MAKKINTKPTTTETTPKTTSAPPKSVTKVRTKIEMRPTEEQIRQRAYELYLRRNGAPGDPASDWRRAEEELRTELSK